MIFKLNFIFYYNYKLYGIYFINGKKKQMFTFHKKDQKMDKWIA